jgi:hypothetical protein
VLVCFCGFFTSADFDVVFDLSLVDVFETGAAFSTVLSFSCVLEVVERGGGDSVDSD